MSSESRDVVAEVHLFGTAQTGFGFVMHLHTLSLVSRPLDCPGDDFYCATAAAWAAIRMLHSLGHRTGGVRFIDGRTGQRAEFDLERRVPVVGSPLWHAGGNFATVRS